MGSQSHDSSLFKRLEDLRLGLGLESLERTESPKGTQVLLL